MVAAPARRGRGRESEEGDRELRKGRERSRGSIGFYKEGEGGRGAEWRNRRSSPHH
jgi:hypothetical protein